MSELDLARVLAAGRNDRPASAEGKARTLAALGLRTAPSAGALSPNGRHLGVVRRTLARRWWPLTCVALAFFGGDPSTSTEAISRDAGVSVGGMESMTLSPAVSPLPRGHEPSAPAAETAPVLAESLPFAEAPKARRRARPVDSPKAPARIERVNTPAPSLRDEIEALEPVSAALAEGACGHARRALADYRKRFPSGRLGHEADVLAIEILGRSGRLDDARRAARDFTARFPETPYGLRLAPWISDTPSRGATCRDDDD